MTSFSIRPATLNDLPAIYEFITGLTGQQFDKDRFAACFEQCITAADNCYMVAEADDKVAGYISCHGQVILHHCGMVYEIQEMYVDEAYRSQGIGAQLLARLEEVIGAEHYELLEVSSNMRRKDAHRFYLRHGFEHTTYKFKKDAGGG